MPMLSQRYNLNANQLFGCRRLFREPEPAAEASRFVGTPGHEAGTAEMLPPSKDASAEAAPATGQMEIVLSGDHRVIVDCAVDPPALARVIAVLVPQ